MTEQEAEAFAERLMLIWLPESPEPCEWTLEEGVFEFLAEGADKMFVSVDNEWDGKSLLVGFSSFATIPTGQGVYLARRATDGKIIIGPSFHAKEAAELANEWMPFFRRGCWLSGCAVEASAHEKAEWIHGFAREEIEAWNLKF